MPCRSLTRKTIAFTIFALSGIALGFLPACNSELPQNSSEQKPVQAATPPVDTNAVLALNDEQIRFDKTVFANEMDAQAYESTFVALWDRLRSTDPFKVFRQFPFIILNLPTRGEWQTLPIGVDGIRLAKLNGENIPFDMPRYLTLIDQLESDGWQVAQTEWHHSAFIPGSEGDSPRSLISFEIHGSNISKERRSAVKGKLNVTWTNQKTKTGLRIPHTIKVEDTTITDYTGKPAFVELLQVDPKKINTKPYPRVSPVIVQDLNKDGSPELILAGSNLVYRNTETGFQYQRFLAYPVTPLGEAGILADFDGDGEADFISTGLNDGLLRIWKANTGGKFTTESRILLQDKLDNPNTMSAADFDLDGDLDLFVGQWKQPYLKGSMPTPYYDANDGYPDFLLINDGMGNFTDGTEQAGLATKRNRRTYSASFADLDGDNDLDLFCVCDFSGIDVYRNNGKGKFTDVTNEWVKQRHGFGMAHTIADFNSDGRLDIYMVGMSSTTARRLDRLNLGRDGFESYDAMRAPMTYGNRLYYGKPTGLQQPKISDDIARTGWSWGTGSADFDNDGDLDLYVANGHLSGNSALDYCTRFWCHDVYTGTSKPNETLDTFFSGKLSGLGSNYSWNGFEHNHMFFSNKNASYQNVAFLFGTAFEFDARAVVVADVDVDGRNDLLIVQYDSQAMQQRLFVMKNNLPTNNNWIGLHIHDVTGQPADGAIVKLFARNRRDIKQLVTGDSFTAQHPSTVHFGLGDSDSVDRLEIHWPSGKTKSLNQPEIRKYHTIKP